MKTAPTHRFWSLALLGLTTLALAACSESPTQPVDEPSGGGGASFVDTPAIPQPSTPGGDVPNHSETITRIESLDGNFRARLLDVAGQWSDEQTCGSLTKQVDARHAWATEAAGRARDYAGLARKLIGSTRDLIGASGERLDVKDSYGDRCDCLAPFSSGKSMSRFDSEPFEADVYIRRDRHWELRPLEGGAGDYLLVYPNTEGQVSSTYTSGSDHSQTQEFGRSITASAGVSFGALSASVSAELSQTFSASVTVHESQSQTFTKTVHGKDGKVVQFMVWELVEDYSFCDAEGQPISSDFFEIQTGSMQRRGAAIALQSTEFDLDN